MDPKGRLTWLIAVPPQVDPSTDPPSSAPDWAALFAAAGLDPGAFTPAASTWTPLTVSDVRSAWTGTYPRQPDIPVRIEAAAYRGLPVHFSVVTPWTRPWLVESIPITKGETVANLILVSLVFIVLIGAVLLARRSLSQGRGDRRGAALAVYFWFDTL